jgi:hypothetical protein
MLMLAYILARLWTVPEATSLWVEIMAYRRKEIVNSCDGTEGSYFAALQAAQQDLTRSELADWDTSARAWLRTADEARAKQQTQLMLIINNLELAVSNNVNAYKTVVSTLNAALTSIENLANGVPQRV